MRFFHVSGVWVFLFILLCEIVPATLYAQKNIAPDREEDFLRYVSQWGQQISGLEKQQNEEISEGLPYFLSRWEQLDPKYREKIIKITRLSQGLQLPIYPDIFRFWIAQAYVDTAFPNIEDPWLHNIETCLEKRKGRDFSRWVQAISQLLKEGILFKSNASTWEVRDADIQWSEEKNTFYISQATIISKAYSDSSVIYETSGMYDPLEEAFYGEGGLVYWDRVKIEREQTYTKLQRYKINLRSSRLNADTAWLYSSWLQQPLVGLFSDKPSALTNVEESTYPQFQSYDPFFLIENVFEAIHIRGAYNQQGKRIVFGNENQPAEMRIQRGDTCLGRVLSSHLIYKEERLYSSLATWIIYQGKDSIYHYTADLRYENQKKLLFMGHSALFGLSMPATDTYHKLRIQFEQIVWDLSKGVLDIGLLQVPDRKGISVFTSLDSYKGAELDILMQGSEHNPLYRLRHLAEKMQTPFLYIEDIARVWGMSETSVISWMLQLTSMGFLDYKVETKEVVLLPKLYLYLQVGAGKSDFDELEFVSEGEGLVKARLYLDSLDLEVVGVKEVLLSRKQNVFIKPSDQKIQIKENRDFCFMGFLHAGTFDFYVRNACFSYDEFKVDIPVVDTLLFSVKGDADEKGRVRESRVSTLIKSLSGVLYIDSTINKGGRADFLTYPVFESHTSSYVTYSDSTIRSGVYPADSFYFRVDPFRMEKLNTFSPDSVRFAGTLFSAGIFPPLLEKLIVMPDLSLGFRTASPSEGWPLYQGRAQYYDQIQLDNSGLTGKGKMEFLNSFSSASDWVFMPNQAEATLDSFFMQEKESPQISYPTLFADSAKMKFEVERSLFFLSSIKGNYLYPYHSPWKFEGEYVFSPQSSTAKGRMLYGEEMVSYASKWNIRQQSFASDTADFCLQTRQNGKRLMFLRSGKAEGDLLTHRVYIKPSESWEDARLSVLFPLQLYRSEAYNIEWNWEEEEVRLDHSNHMDADTLSTIDGFNGKSIGLPFVSIQKGQDSLSFYALQSVLYLKDTLLKIGGVSRISVADALWLPNAREVNIGKDGKLQMLKNARLLFSKEYPVFEFCKVEGQILSARSYKASGWYNYNSPSVGVQPIFFEKIAAGLESHSVAQGIILPQEQSGQEWKMDEGFAFSGKVTISALDALWRKRADILFEGLARMRYTHVGERSEEEYDQGEGREQEETSEIREMPEDSTALLSHGFRFKAYICCDSVRIPISNETKNAAARLVRAGFFSRATSGVPQFVFMEPVRSADQAVVSAEGNLSFDQEFMTYSVADSLGKEKLLLQLKTGDATATDFLHLNLRTGDFRNTFYGSVTRKTQPFGFYIQAVCNLDFFFSQALFKMMAEELNKNTSMEGGTPADRPFLIDYARKSLLNREAQNVIKELSNYGTLNRIPDEWKKGILFSHLNLEWDENSSSYRSIGNAEILTLGEQMINKKVKVMMQISRGRRGDEVDLYIEASKYSWYYFNYSDQVLQVISSDPLFNESLAAMKVSKRKKGHYEFVVSTMRKKNIFVSYFGQDGKKEEGADNEMEDTE